MAYLYGLDRLKNQHVDGCAASLSKNPGKGFVAIFTEQPAPVAPAPQCAPCNGKGSISDDDGIDMGLCNFCDGSGAKSAVVAMPEVLRNTIHNTLRHYRMGTLSDGEGCGYPLIDAMSVDGQTVSGGIEECEYLAESIFSACIAEVARLNGVKP